MKRPKQQGPRVNSKQKRIKHNSNLRASSHNDRVTELLKICLRKVCELQANLQINNAEEHDPEAEGYAACAMETIRFLSAEGVPPNDPIVMGLTNHLMRERESND